MSVLIPIPPTDSSLVKHSQTSSAWWGSFETSEALPANACDALWGILKVVAGSQDHSLSRALPIVMELVLALVGT